jgi:Fe-S-cluster containining protein
MIPLRNDITACDHCGVCCQRSPCTVASLEEVEAIERKLGASIRDGLWVLHRNGGHEVIISAPPCRFHVDNRCAIHDVKPTGGRNFKCWEPSHGRRLTWHPDQLRELGATHHLNR